jgi:hypothetical protein
LYRCNDTIEFSFKNVGVHYFTESTEAAGEGIKSNKNNERTLRKLVDKLINNVKGPKNFGRALEVWRVKDEISMKPGK